MSPVNRTDDLDEDPRPGENAETFLARVRAQRARQDGAVVAAKQPGRTDAYGNPVAEDPYERNVAAGRAAHEHSDSRITAATPPRFASLDVEDPEGAPWKARPKHNAPALLAEASKAAERRDDGPRLGARAEGAHARNVREGREAHVHGDGSRISAK